MKLPEGFSDYKPSFLFRNGHINTVYPYFFRRIKRPPYVRVRINTPDQDFLDIDTLISDDERIAIICHGLEGSSSSQYIQGISDHLHNGGWDVAAMNYRFCTEDINLQPRVYHSGATNDLQTVVEYFKPSYKEICLIGFSLGGNLVLKYCGERESNIDSAISSCVAISVPTDLHAGSLHIDKPSNYFYGKRFLETLKEKMVLKHAQFPDVFPIENLKKVKTLFDFDDHYTGPVHGFKDAKDYYSRSSCAQFLHSICIPTLMINALDDPFLPEACYPHKETNANSRITFLTPKHGGHVGFTTLGENCYWSEKMISNFIEKIGGS